MIKDIKEIWSVFNGKSKGIALNRLLDEFKNTSEVAIRQNWIYQGRIPKKHQSKVLDLFKEILNEQIKSMEVLVS